ncbi:hypothetical protein HOD61_01565 [archaeon]|nr:hypothetical protein [archaeon]
MSVKLSAIIIITLLLVPGAFAYSFSDFFEDFSDTFSSISITGMAILEVAETVKEKVTIEKEPLAPPEPKKVEVKEIKEESEEVVEKKEIKKSTSSSSKSSKRVPECSDYLDNNINYFKKGICKDNRGRFVKGDYPEDYCGTDKTMVMEFSCNSEEMCEGNWYVCPNGCEDGACKKEIIEKELAPDLKILSTDINNCEITSTVKNIGSKETSFKIDFKSEEHNVLSNIEYKIQPNEIIDVMVENHCFEKETNYSIEVISDNEINLEDNIKSGITNKETIKPIEITGNVVNIKEENQEGIINKLKNIIINIINIIK